ncbi:putative sugar O-methyltransferase [Phyllobacterium pellucidum]|uniref:putative sugar O-methyltransferase n=1 Tax=Phyllobacterium pellucidum TaxID=2740464 RepID=UPI001F36499B|nr:putative sugar O-methyltransferase [Phyllobacterium sp. T1018]UGY10666.1 putative sugar O-methyltransferase [Phyllobacterium sp. T1018]
MHQFSPAVGCIDDIQLVRRVRQAYKAAHATFSDYGESQWGTLDSWKSAIHSLVVRGTDDDLTDALRNPATTELFYGFDLIGASRTQALNNDSGFRDHQAMLVAHAIEALASAVGVARVNNPEAPDHYPPEQRTSDQLIDLINPIVRAEFPNPFPNEFGLSLKAGVANLRAVFAIYQQYRTLQMLRIGNGSSVLEIGAGLGRTVYYCHQSGVKDYTIIDLPMTNLAQGYFLGRTLGAENVCLFGEDYRPGAVRILPPACLSDVKADVVVNVDSLTEMDRSAADTYVKHALETAKVLLSINHEVNSFTANQVIKAHAPDIELMRYPAPMRAGYIEEIAFIR